MNLCLVQYLDRFGFIESVLPCAQPHHWATSNFEGKEGNMPSSAWQGNSVKCRLADAKSNDRRQTWHDDRRALDRVSPDAYQTDYGIKVHYRTTECGD